MTALRSMLDQNHIPMRVLDVTPRMRDGHISRMANRLLWVERLRESAWINKDHHKVKQAEYLGNMIADRIKSMYSFKHQ